MRVGGRLCFLVWALGHSPCLVIGRLERAILLSRHGQRESLTKHHTTLHESGLIDEGGPRLTRSGLGQLQRVGKVFHNLYFAPTCQNSSCLAGHGSLNEEDIHAESTGLARTLSTAAAVLQTLALSEATIALPQPVYSRLESNDFLLRGYAGGKCAALADGIQRLLVSSAFAAMSANSTELREEVGALLLSLNAANRTELVIEPKSGRAAVALRDWWNAWDVLANTQPPLLSESSMMSAERLIAWLEGHKFGTSSQGWLCGGALATEVLRRLAAPLDRQRLVYYSAHYPTLLCLLGALGISIDSGEASDHWLREEMIPPASVLAFELHSTPTVGEGVSYHVQLWLLNGDELRDNSSDPVTTAASRFKPDGGAGGWRRLSLPCQSHQRLSRCMAPLLRADTSNPSSPFLYLRSSLSNVSDFCASCGSSTLEMTSCPHVTSSFADSGKMTGFEVACVVLLPSLAVALTSALILLVYTRRHAAPVVVLKPTVSAAGKKDLELNEARRPQAHA